MKYSRSQEITSLIEIKRKQNIRHWLTNVPNARFEFFIEMNKKIRDLQTLNNLTLYTFIHLFQLKLASPSQFKRKKALFTDKNKNVNIISSLFDEVLSKYLKMSFNQFIRECNKRFAAEKRKSHRKQVMQKRANHMV